MEHPPWVAGSQGVRLTRDGAGCPVGVALDDLLPLAALHEGEGATDGYGPRLTGVW